MLKFKGKFTGEIIREGKVIEKFDFPNGITDQGMNNILDVMFHGDAQTGTWYIGLIDNAGFTAIAAADTHDTHAGWVESAAYDEATRPEWTEGAAAAKSITNAVAVAFTINATTALYGLFIASISTKSSVSGAGILWSTGAFDAVKNVVDNDELRITYTVTVA